VGTKGPDYPRAPLSAKAPGQAPPAEGGDLRPAQGPLQ